MQSQDSRHARQAWFWGRGGGGGLRGTHLLLVVVVKGTLGARLDSQGRGYVQCLFRLQAYPLCWSSEEDEEDW